MTVMSRIGEVAADRALGLAGNANVRTPCGARHIANLRPGDLVVTRDNGLVPVRMIWTRTVTEAEMAADPSLAPVRLTPRCIGPMMPQRDLVVAGDHRLLIPGYRLADQPDAAAALIAARDIAESSDKAFVNRAHGDITYYNLVFDAQQVFAANGLPVESYLPSPDNLSRLAAKVRDDIERVFPDLHSPTEDYSALSYPISSREQYLPEFA